MRGWDEVAVAVAGGLKRLDGGGGVVIRAHNYGHVHDHTHSHTLAHVHVRAFRGQRKSDARIEKQSDRDLARERWRGCGATLNASSFAPLGRRPMCRLRWPLVLIRGDGG